MNTSGSYRWLVLGLVMMGTFMSILDTSIVNVALPHMMSAFGVDRDRIEWVSTAFMLATAVAMPLVGFIVNRVGSKILYLSSLTLFTFGSALCALAWSYHSLIVARIVQAVGGGAIQPVGMAIVAELFEPHERGRALGIWGTGIMLGPAIGPTLGGYLTEWFNWRSIFSVNLPFGIITLIFGLILMKSEKSPESRTVPFDWWGYTFLSLALITGLLALSEGQSKGWDSTYILTCFGLSIAGLTMFLAVESSILHPLLDLKLFLYRNFSISMVLALFRAVGLFGGVFLLPIFLENLVGYTTIQTGLWMMPTAVTVGLMMPIAGKMADRYSPSWLVSTGTLITGLSLIAYGRLDPLSGWMTIILPQMARGAGLALMMAPLMTTAINSVPRHQVATASSFLNVAQRLGGSFGIAMLNTVVTNAVHRHAVRLGELAGPNSHPFHSLSSRITPLLIRDSHGVLITSQIKTMVVSTKMIIQKASVLGFQNGFVFAGLVILLGFPLCLLLRKPTPAASIQPALAAPQTSPVKAT